MILRNLVILGILVNLVDLVILATPVASCYTRISVESGDSVEFCDSDKSSETCTVVVMRNMMIFVN